MSRALSRLLVGVLSASFVLTGYVAASPAPAAAAGSGSVSLSALDTAYSQPFDTLATSGTTNQSLPEGWFLSESGTSSVNNDAYAAGTGSSNSGDVYSFGATGNLERAFGTLLSGSLTPVIGAAFTNNTGSTIGALDIGYDGEQWRLGALGTTGSPPRGPDRLDFQYSLDATSLTTGAWTDADGLDFVSPIQGPTVGALDGNLAANRTSISAAVGSLGIAPGATFWIRWSDFNVGSSDDGLAVDGFTLTPRAVVGPPRLSIDDVTQSEGDSGTTSFDFTVSLSSAAGDGGVTFDIATADGTATVADSDYVANALTNQSIAAGGTSYAFSVAVNRDTAAEGDETFLVNVTNVTGATVADGQGVGTITGDDVDFCAQEYTPIYEIQGSGSSAAVTGSVTTEGVVVGDFGGTTRNSGFFIQDPDGDENAATSDGIFVFTGNADPVDEGDLVRVTGFARERFNQTTINGSNSNTSPVTDIIECGDGSVAPTDVQMPFEAGNTQEQYEGMLVRFPQPLVIAEYFNYDRFGELVLALPLEGESRPFTGTAIEEPGAAANARTAANMARRITLDDNQSDSNPDVLRHPNGDPFSLTNRFRGGDTVENAVGVLGFDFSQYRIFPTDPADYTATNPRPGDAPEDVGGSLKVAAMNTLNYFLTADVDNPNNGPGDNVCGGNANLECRGWDASQTDELERQRDKLIDALAKLDADVLGLNEIENTPDVDVLADIVSGLNTAVGADTYARIDTGVIGTDAIRVGLVYQPGSVVPVGDFQVLDSTDDRRFIDTKSRPALAQTFEEIATGARFTVVVNHLKSKGSDCNDVGDPDAGDGQGNCNGTRTLAAQALVDWIASDPTGSGDPDFLIMGDLNSYAMEDPIDAIKAGADDAPGTDDDWTNLIAEYQGTFAYSFVFDGQAGYLDHAMANATIVGQVTGAADWHINADEPDVLDYDTSFKPPAQDALYEPNQFRTSDHDPVVVGLGLVNDAPTIEVSAGTSCMPSDIGGSFVLSVDDTERAPGDLVVTLDDNSNPTLVPDANVALGGSGADRTVAIEAAKGRSGMAVLTFAVFDGWNTTTETITVRVGTGAGETIVGTAGADLIAGSGGGDAITGGDGADVLCGGNGDDTIAGGDGNDAVAGGRGADDLSGGDGDDVLDGGFGDDALSGDEGDDALTGGRGADAFSGGPGADVNVDLTPSQGDTTDGT